MAKLRFKLSQRHKSKQQQQPNKQRPHQQQGGRGGLPRIPYIRCGFLQGKPPRVLPTSTDEHSSSRLPHSPVNKKAADIAFPCPPIPVTPLPKKWLTLGCDPCKQQTNLLHEDYKLPPSSVGIRRQGEHPNADGRDRRRRRNQRLAVSSPLLSSSPPPPSPSCSSSSPATRNPEDWQPEMRWKVVARSDNEVVQKQVVLHRKSSASSSKQQQQPPPPQSITDQDAAAESLAFKSGSETVYKLMTTSPDQSTENDSSYAWEKDLSPFASESGIFNSFDSPNNVHTKAASNRVCVPPRNRKAIISSRYLSSSSSCSVFKLASPVNESKQCLYHCSASPPLSPGHFDGYQLDPEALSKSWEDDRALETQAQQNVKYLSLQHRESKQVKHRQKQKQFSPVFTSRVMESFAVEKASVNPYRDFRESMIEMILKKELFQYRDLEELLRTYLILNNEKFHDLIVQVFTDLWYHLYSYDSS